MKINQKIGKFLKAFSFIQFDNQFTFDPNQEEYQNLE